VRPISQVHLNHLFSINKVSRNCLVISHLCVFATISLPCYHSFGYSLSHQYSYFSWPTRGTMSPATTLKIMGRTTTKTSTHHHPLHLLLSKCWLCMHKCFRPCSRQWSTFMPNLRHHHHRGIGLEIFSAPSHQIFSHAVEPMDADDWLKFVEKKLQVVQYNNHEKVLLVSHQLSGPTTHWCDAYMEAHEEPESINWSEFRAAFCAHHVP
jgi:hypothetical protein